MPPIRARIRTFMFAIAAVAVLMGLVRVTTRVAVTRLAGLSGVSAGIDGLEIWFDSIATHYIDDVFGTYVVHDQSCVRVCWPNLAVPIALTSTVMALFVHVYHRSCRMRRRNASGAADRPIGTPWPARSG
jgi:hypothetical protein